MTSRERVDTNLIRIISLLYSMQADDIAVLNEQITQQTTTEYLKTIGAQLRLYSCQKSATGPDNQATQWIQDKAAKDSMGIAATYNRELAAQVQRIYSANPRANRFTFIKELEAWTATRNQHKVASIALNTLTQARQYAQDRFVAENNIQGRWVFTGPPPVCKICMRIKALGVVTLETTKKRPLPSHPNCPHRWSQVIPSKIECSEAWTG